MRAAAIGKFDQAALRFRLIYQSKISLRTVCCALMIGFASLDCPLASPEITVAGIATGRLYVAGNTDKSHTTVNLDGQFEAKSDAMGNFHFELVYHPQTCIVSAQIEGKTYEAVVSNCSQSCAAPAPVRSTSKSKAEAQSAPHEVFSTEDPKPQASTTEVPGPAIAEQAQPMNEKAIRNAPLPPLRPRL